MRPGALLLSAVLAAPAAPPARTTPLVVTVGGLPSTDGDVVACLWAPDDPGFPNCATGSPTTIIRAPAADPRLRFDAVAPGKWAVSLFHDEDGDGRPRTSRLGLPLCAVGLSLDPEIGPLRRPTFARSAFRTPATRTLSITARTVLP